MMRNAAVVLRAAGVLLVAGLGLAGLVLHPNALNDPKAVYLTRDDFAAQGDGVADDTFALQRAIDRVQETTRQGIVFVPAGRYRLTNTVYVWPGIRLIGYGTERPVFRSGQEHAGLRR